MPGLFDCCNLLATLPHERARHPLKERLFSAGKSEQCSSFLGISSVTTGDRHGWNLADYIRGRDDGQPSRTRRLEHCFSPTDSRCHDGAAAGGIDDGKSRRLACFGRPDALRTTRAGSAEAPPPHVRTARPARLIFPQCRGAKN
jgi:hypothetical protein